MSYSTGSAADLAGLRQSLFDACTADGWTLTGEILSKGTMFLRVQIVSGYLTFLGGTGQSAGALTGAAGAVSRIGLFAGQALVFPVKYEIFTFAAEVYLVVNYNVSCYQWAAFGRTTVQGVPGTGMWFGASVHADNAINIGMLHNGGSGSTNYCIPALFYRDRSFGTWGAGLVECKVHHGLDSLNWSDGVNTANPGASAIDALYPLLGMLPNAWNSEAILLPIRVFLPRPSNKLSLVADIEHARYTRVDNYTPGDIITLGADRWKVFPWYLKNAAARTGGANVTHSGTFGWAVRYEGP
ncbi:hypothetical protein NK553_14640 [Pseudomonas sp. ZM23]|uniref:Virion structural protein n=1 Tax=Pseudomonas triclosanedens TaxID=2961893 RepID=A0ABY6ZWW9_9PSED|nr:hypothetical protein [Pseudomonas triclosanedens]MCP8465187.1 hypothetical protein [Pseudomonas triclosanedens]MCP8470873.1 hypothetical protein [Pseudomonas triclosanedens]MCP8476558.1 hypothetical protein [Pseudomonas triclosanedens]WAI49057.1 hypothetical protein OU419_25460 [Pseudomonas triclosanedens]